MKVVCAVGRRGGPELIQHMIEIIRSEAEVLFLNVIDTGPRHGLEDFLRGPLHRRPHHDIPPREESVRVAEEKAGHMAVEETMEAARKFGLKAASSIKQGRPEELILQVSRGMKADLIVMWAREGTTGRILSGPASIGHIARFVLDHATCSVLLLKEKED